MKSESWSRGLSQVSRLRPSAWFVTRPERLPAGLDCGAPLTREWEKTAEARSDLSGIAAGGPALPEQAGFAGQDGSEGTGLKTRRYEEGSEGRLLGWREIW